MEDIARALTIQLPQIFPSALLDEKLIQEARRTAVNTKHSDPSRTIPIWNGKSECLPGQFGSFAQDQGFVFINTWITPEYRLRSGIKPETRHLDIFLQRTMPRDIDRQWFKDWLAWCLQNEAEKPGWAVFLYSRNKGTGKSTLLRLMTKLFGEGNSINCNTVDSVTGRFNAPVFEKKFISVEEVQLKQGTQLTNRMKTFVTERDVTVERKGQNIRQVRQCSVFVFTSNHLPKWMEEGERRYLVIETDHDGHSRGAERENFVRFIKLFNEMVLSKPNAIASIHKGLMQHSVSEHFDPQSLPFDRIDTPVMRKLQNSGVEVQRQRLEELLEAEDLKAISQEDLCRLMDERLKIPPNRVQHLMDELGWTSDKKKWGGKDYTRVIWIRPSFTLHQGRLKDAQGQVVQIHNSSERQEDRIQIIDQPAPASEDAPTSGQTY